MCRELMAALTGSASAVAVGSTLDCIPGLLVRLEDLVVLQRLADRVDLGHHLLLVCLPHLPLPKDQGSNDYQVI